MLRRGVCSTRCTTSSLVLLMAFMKALLLVEMSILGLRFQTMCCGSITFHSDMEFRCAQIKMVVLGELGGKDEYSLVDALKQGKVSKPVVAWVSGTCAFSSWRFNLAMQAPRVVAMKSLPRLRVRLWLMLELLYLQLLKVE